MVCTYTLTYTLTITSAQRFASKADMSRAGGGIPCFDIEFHLVYAGHTLVGIVSM